MKDEIFVIMKQKFTIKSIVPIIIGTILCASIVCIFIYNHKNNKSFFETNVASLLQIVVVIVISYYFVQRRTDERKQIDVLDRVIRKLQEECDCLHSKIEEYAVCIIENSKAIEDCAVDRKILQSSIRSIEKRIDMISGYEKNPTFKNEIDTVSKNFSEYKKHFEEIYAGVTDGNKHLDDLKRLYPLLSNSFEKIAIELFIPSKIK